MQNRQLLHRCFFFLSFALYVLPQIVFGSPTTPTAETDTLVDLAQQIEFNNQSLDDPEIPEQFKDNFRTLAMYHEAMAEQIKGNKAAFDDRLVRITNLMVSNTSSSDIVYSFKLASMLSMSVELDWISGNHKVISLFNTATADQELNVTTAYQRISFEFMAGNQTGLEQTLSKLPVITDKSNSWELFVNGYANLLHYRMAGDEASLRQAIKFLEKIPSTNIALQDIGISRKQELFLARVRMQLTRAHLLFSYNLNDPGIRHARLVEALEVWSLGELNSIIIDHPALWGARMYLYAEILDEALVQLKAKEFYSEADVEEISIRRDEAYFIASKYR